MRTAKRFGSGRGRRFIWSGLGLLLGVALLIFGVVAACPWRVVPPAEVRQPGIVFVSDYGRHSRLALQASDGHVVEFSYGDWRYYAMGERTLWRGFVGLARPTLAGLGRRDLPLVEDEEEFRRLAGAVRSARVTVEREKVDAVLQRLERRYRANVTTEIYSDVVGMHFVEDELPYHLFQNSNHQTAAWLRELGCDVSGGAILSNFNVIE